MKDSNREREIENMEYAIHSNEIEGIEITKEDREFLMAVARREMTIEEALKIVLEEK